MVAGSRGRRDPDGSPLDGGQTGGLLRVALVAAAVLAASAGPAAGHPGEGGGAVDPASPEGRVLEAERYEAADPSCDPDGDGEHIYPKRHEEASGGAHVFLPHSGCGVAFQDVEVAEPAAVDRIRLRRSNCGAVDAYGMEVQLTRGGDPVATVPFAADRDDCGVFRPLPAEGTAPIPAGSTDLRLEVTITDGPGWLNAKVDKIVFRPGQEEPAGSSQDPSEPSLPSVSPFELFAYASPLLALAVGGAVWAKSGGPGRP